MSSTDTNQASEDELREQLADKLEWYSRYRERGQDDDMDRAFDGILALIRHEKLKLLAEVSERVVGENDYQPGNPAPDLVEHNQLVRDGLRFEQRVELTKLEAEL